MPGRPLPHLKIAVRLGRGHVVTMCPRRPPPGRYLLPPRSRPPPPCGQPPCHLRLPVPLSPATLPCAVPRHHSASRRRLHLRPLPPGGRTPPPAMRLSSWPLPPHPVKPSVRHQKVCPTKSRRPFRPAAPAPSNCAPASPCPVLCALFSFDESTTVLSGECMIPCPVLVRV